MEPFTYKGLVIDKEQYVLNDGGYLVRSRDEIADWPELYLDQMGIVMATDDIDEAIAVAEAHNKTCGHVC